MEPTEKLFTEHTGRFPGEGRNSGRGWLFAAAAITVLTLQASISFGQSAGSFGTKPTTSQPAQVSSKVSAKAPKESLANTIPPSRFVGEADFEAFINSLSAQLSMKGRETDPFGQLQDPNAKPVIKSSVAKTSKRPVQVQSTPFPEIINQIRVNTIMPGEKQFLIAARTYKQGGTLSIIHRGKTILAQITDVTSRQIDFRNQESGETASLKIEALPPGMTMGTKGITAPGMAPDAQDAPINLDVGNP